MVIDFEHIYKTCENVEDNWEAYKAHMRYPLFWTSIFLLLLSILSILLTIKSILVGLKWFITNSIEKLKDIPINPIKKVIFNLGELHHYFSMWIITQTIADVSNIISSVFILFYTINERDFFMGLGALFTVLSLSKHLEPFPKYYLLVNISKRAFMNFLSFGASVLPFFLGYALLGTILFGHYSDFFENIEQTMVTMVAALNGDALLEIYNMTFGYNPFFAYLSRIYLFVLMFIFTWTSLNILLLIVVSLINITFSKMHSSY